MVSSSPYSHHFLLSKMKYRNRSLFPVLYNGSNKENIEGKGDKEESRKELMVKLESCLNIKKLISVREN